MVILAIGIVIMLMGTILIREVIVRNL
ncbi:hypothetical protein [endosymbiont 'TC1' of Trimyema compressum]